MNTKIRGNWGEAKVAEYLRKKRYNIVASQFSCRYGEVDLIAEKDGTLCMVEVKTRTQTKISLPRDSVNTAKQNRIKSAAAFYLAKYDMDCPVRFDVAEVYTDENLSRAEIVYLENAFQ